MTARKEVIVDKSGGNFIVGLLVGMLIVAFVLMLFKPKDEKLKPMTKEEERAFMDTCKKEHPEWFNPLMDVPQMSKKDYLKWQKRGSGKGTR
jgi:gas vesicle protein